MTLPSSLAELKIVSVRGQNGERWLLELAGVSGWCREFPHGLCVVIAVEKAFLDDVWLARASRWIASVPGNLDDALLIEGERLFLMRRYAHDLPGAELERGITHQLTVARWLAKHGEGVRDGAPADLAGRWL